MATAADRRGTDLVAVAQGFGQLPNASKIGVIIGLAAILAVAVATILYTRTPDYRVLFSNLADRDGGAIVGALTQMNVPYKIAEGGGAILVPGAQVHDVRLRLASQGLPRGSSVGFELLENQKFGITQFQEHVNYQRALEGELARSIQSLSAAQSARVHLALPKQTVFLRDQQKPTASVLVTLYPGKSLDRSQIAGILHLIASSVPELMPKNVSIVDQTGTLLSSSGEADDLRLDPNQLAYVQQVEANYVKRITELLEPMLGRANFRAQVTADLDFNATESTDERFKPNRNPQEAAVRSEQSNDAANSASGPGAQGVPGALSNQPPGQTVAPITNPPARPNAPAADSANGVRNPTSTQRNTVVNYEVDRSVRHTRNATGAVKRLSTAVVIAKRDPAPAGAPAEGETPKPEAPKAAAGPTDEEIANIVALVKEAIGFREDRGDTLKVTSATFNSAPAAEPAPEVPLWKQPGIISLAIDIAKSLGAILAGLWLILGVIRPMLRQLATPRVEVLPAPSEAPDDDSGARVELSNAASNANPAADRLQAAKQLAKQDPKLVATVVKQWVNES